MTHVHHELAEEFPEHKARIHELKMSDRHFARLADEYHLVNREIHRVEANGIDIGDAAFEELKKKRLRLKDEIFELLTA